MLHAPFDLCAARWTLTADPPHDTPDRTGPSPALRSALHSGVRATVPGSVHTDLLAAGLIQDPYTLGAETQLAWIGHTHWTYTAAFDLPAAALNAGRLDLACDGLDTFAELSLNAAPIGSARNMHRRHRFDLRPAARAGANTLTLRFAAPVPAAWAAQAEHGALPHQGHGSNPPFPHNMVRRMACSHGWDWGPALPSAGVWRGIRIEPWTATRLAQVRPAVTQATAQCATLAVCIDLDTDLEPDADTAAPTVRMSLAAPGGHNVIRAADARVTGSTAQVTLTVPDPQRWWPVGHGAQPLYTLTTELHAADGQLMQTDVRRVGLRTVSLDTTPDAAPGAGAAVDGLPTGETMTLRVNDKPVFLKGANWIPNDCFPARSEDPAQLRERVDQLRAANGNCLRVWGGGVYPCQALLEHCDATGMLVWQDFMFACAGYPEDAAYAAEVQAEARDNVSRLASHPSVAIYNGNNECIWGTWDWDDAFKAMGRNTAQRGWGLHYWLDLLPRIVAELDPSRPYWPASPWSGHTDRHPNDNAFGNRHIWNVWHGAGHHRNYLSHFPRMATEFGYHGPPSAATLLPHVPEAQQHWNSNALEFYNRNGGLGGQRHTDLRLADDFDPPHDNLDDWLYLTQVMQARALETGCTWFRALHPWCSAAVYWQWNDCWPVSSWSAVDSGGRRKPLWYATRRFFAPQLMTLKPQRPLAQDADPSQSLVPLAVYLHNDTDAHWTGHLNARRVDLCGNTLDTQDLCAHVPPRHTTRVDLPAAWCDRPHDTALVVRDPSAAHADAWWWFNPDKQLAYPRADLNITVTPTGHRGDARLSITARTLVRDLCVFPDRLHPDAAINDHLLTLLPGDVAELLVTSSVALDPVALTCPPVMQWVNRFGATSSPHRDDATSPAGPAPDPPPAHRANPPST